VKSHFALQAGKGNTSKNLVCRSFSSWSSATQRWKRARRETPQPHPDFCHFISCTHCYEPKCMYQKGGYFRYMRQKSTFPESAGRLVLCKDRLPPGWRLHRWILDMYWSDCMCCTTARHTVSSSGEPFFRPFSSPKKIQLSSKLRLKKRLSQAWNCMSGGGTAHAIAPAHV